MIELKKNKYADLNLMCGIDTVSIRTDQQPRTDSNGKLPDGVTDIGSSNGLITLKINPNKWCGDGIELYSFGDYCAAMRQILKQIHHVRDKRHNQAWYLLALTPAEHRALHAALAKDTTGVQKSA